MQKYSDLTWRYCYEHSGRPWSRNDDRQFKHHADSSCKHQAAIEYEQLLFYIKCATDNMIGHTSTFHKPLVVCIVCRKEKRQMLQLNRRPSNHLRPRSKFLRARTASGNWLDPSHPVSADGKFEPNSNSPGTGLKFWVHNRMHRGSKSEQKKVRYQSVTRSVFLEI